MAEVTFISRLGLSEDQAAKLEHGALLHRRYSNIRFTILEADENSVTVQVAQGKSGAENYADPKRLVEITRELLAPFTDRKVHVRAQPYKEHQVSLVDAEWIQLRMQRKGVAVKDIVADTGIDKTNISAWVNGKRPMSQPAKAMFYFYFLSKEKK